MKNINKAEAAHSLSDEIFDLTRACGKAAFIMQEVNENFFSYDNPKEKAAEIAWDYQRYAVLSDAVEDYIYKMSQALESLTKLYEEQEAKSDVK